MHLYALDEKQTLQAAHQAEKQKDYFCPECQSVVRKRGGFLRQTHFYHLEPNRACRQSGKTIVHLQTQHYMNKILPDCELEKRFSAINRIADVVWEKEKLIFEIQCSPITAKEIEARNRDYHSLGYRVIWILHNRLYNKSRLTAAEFFLQEIPHYFTDMNADGEGFIYDQWCQIHKGKRLDSLDSRKVNLASYQISKGELFSQKEYPMWMNKRIQSWPFYFSGDCLDYLFNSEEEKKEIILAEIREKEEKLFEPPKKASLREKLKKALHFIAFPYRLTFYLILDKLAK